MKFEAIFSKIAWTLFVVGSIVIVYKLITADTSRITLVTPHTEQRK